MRSEQTLKLVVAEMYVQGVSTRKVTEITEKLCGLEITSAQVSRATAVLDVSLGKWRNIVFKVLKYRFVFCKVSSIAASIFSNLSRIFLICDFMTAQ